MAFNFPRIDAAGRLEIKILFVTAARRRTERFARMMEGSPSVSGVEWVPAGDAPDDRILRQLDEQKSRGPAVVVLDYACLGQETWRVLRTLQKKISDRLVEWIVVGLTAPLPSLPGVSWQNVTVLPERTLATA